MPTCELVLIIIYTFLDLESQATQNVKELRQKLHSLEVVNANLRSDLMAEQKNLRNLQKEHSSCETKQKIYQQEIEYNKQSIEIDESKNTSLLNSTLNLASLERIASPTPIEKTEKSCSTCCRKAAEELERRLKKTQLKLAEAKAEKRSLLVSEKKLIETLEIKKSRLEQTEEALARLKTKSRTLLRQYRSKKQTLSSVSSKLDTIRNSLFELQNLCKTKDDNYREILSHFGGQIEISARLLANYLNVPMSASSFNIVLKVRLSSF